ncbi:hypothetical protein MCG44_14280, partial [Lawsonibacter sp. OA9]|nr:hypothetical protein [Lawsonibacter sp. OA9]
MKKLLAVLLTMGLVLGMTGCSGGSAGTAGGSPGDDPALSEGTEASGGAGKVETDIKVSEDKIQAASEETLGDWEVAYTEEYAPSGEEEYTW